MIQQYILRIVKRLAILVPGIVIAFFSVRDIFPLFDSRLPMVVSILATYIVGAYVLVPALIRLYRMVRPADHLPLYCVTPDGFASDPLNVGIIATRDELIAAMEKSGWHIADPHNLKNLIRAIASTILGQPYPTAPVSSLYLFGRKQDIAFEIPVGSVNSSRHHVRFWATTYQQKKRLTVKNIHWQHRREHVYNDTLLWVGAASLDLGINLIRYNLQVTHMIAPDTNKERELLVEQLRAVKLVEKTQAITLGQPYRLMNRVWLGSLHTDGKMAIVSLKQPRRRR